MENNERNNSRGPVAIAFLIGAVAGGIAALLLAPQTGAQMRGRIKSGARDLRDRGTRLAHEAGERADMVKGAASEARTAYRDEMEKRRTSPARSAVVDKVEPV
jgi:gas vesicle protein